MDKTIVRKLDDVEAKAGREYDATHAGVELSFEGQAVSLDLGDANYGTLKSAVDKFLAAGTPVKGRSGGAPRQSRSGGSSGGRKASSRPKSSDAQRAAYNEAIREWVRTKRPDLTVSDKGRISNQVIEEYNREHPDWEKTFFMDSADDSAPSAPAPAHARPEVDEHFDDQQAPADPVQEPEQDVQVPAQGTQVDEHGWETETPTAYTGVGSYS